MLVLGAPAIGVAEGFQNQPAPPTVKPEQEPQTEAQSAQQYQRGAGVYINRPLTQVSKQADALLDDLEGRCCDFFYNEASPKTGLVRDRAPAVGRSLSRVASIAATGFGLTAMCIAAKRNYLPKLQCEARVEKTLAFLLEDCPHEHGFLYHFIDIDSGQRMFGSELSSIDTALLLCGVLTCRQYFSGNPRIEALATTFYRRIDWDWMLNGGTTLSMGWLPDQGFLKHRWDIYAELMTMYLLAIGSPTHPITVETWNALQRPLVQFGGIDYISGLAPLFIHQYAHAWCDYRDQRDLHTNYFTQFDCGNAGASTVVPDAGGEVSVDRSGFVGNIGIGFAGGLPRLGRTSSNGAARWNSSAVSMRRVAAVSSGGVLACAADDAAKIWRQGVDAVWICRCVQPEDKLVLRRTFSGSTRESAC